MRILLCPNRFTDEQILQAKQCVSVLEEKCGHVCTLLPEDSVAVYGNDGYVRFQQEECDLVISLGGDGSVLRAASYAVELGKPLLGINSGRLGYLCVIGFEDIERFNEVFDKLTLTRRHLLNVFSEGNKYTAINDIVFGKKNGGSTVDLEIHIDNQSELNIRGDGIIFATATGSTAYNLSAGGPMLSPDLDAFVMTPVCPHARNEYPVVLNGSHVVTVAEKNKTAEIYVDGVNVSPLRDKAVVSKSELELFLYTDGNVLKAF
ncbi:MAG: NAD(+)/NADH kinase [Oscillospiraceae bacterium]|nr:NAD(+)/NADH kinase [Oscillospiraceae bacterium]